MGAVCRPGAVLANHGSLWPYSVWWDTMGPLL